MRRWRPRPSRWRPSGGYGPALLLRRAALRRRAERGEQGADPDGVGVALPVVAPAVDLDRQPGLGRQDADDVGALAQEPDPVPAANDTRQSGR